MPALSEVEGLGIAKKLAFFEQLLRVDADKVGKKDYAMALPVKTFNPFLNLKSPAEYRLTWGGKGLRNNALLGEGGVEIGGGTAGELLTSAEAGDIADEAIVNDDVLFGNMAGGVYSAGADGDVVVYDYYTGDSGDLVHSGDSGDSSPAAWRAQNDMGVRQVFELLQGIFNPARFADAVVKNAVRDGLPLLPLLAAAHPLPLVSAMFGYVAALPDVVADIIADFSPPKFDKVNFAATLQAKPGNEAGQTQVPSTEEQVDAKIAEFIEGFDAVRASLPSKEELLAITDAQEAITKLRNTFARLLDFIKSSGLERNFDLNLPEDSFHVQRISMFRHTLGTLVAVVNLNILLIIEKLSERLDIDINNSMEHYERGRTEILKIGQSGLGFYLKKIAGANGVLLLLTQEAETLLKGLEVEFLADSVRNLIINVAKYHPRDGKSEPTLKVSVEEREGLRVLVFQDNAGGIPPEISAKIFNEEVHGDPAKPGQGKGLFITKQLIEKMGGKIWFETTLGEGTTFYIWLPRFGDMPVR